MNTQRKPVLEHANRDTGSWLPGVERCPRRFVPCGNPGCADEAMRSSEIETGSVLGRLTAEHAAEHAAQIAQQCPVFECPLESATGMPRQKALAFLGRRS